MPQSRHWWTLVPCHTLRPPGIFLIPSSFFLSPYLSNTIYIYLLLVSSFWALAHFYHKSTTFIIKVSHFFHKSVTFRKHPVKKQFSLVFFKRVQRVVRVLTQLLYWAQEAFGMYVPSTPLFFSRSRHTIDSRNSTLQNFTKAPLA